MGAEAFISYAGTERDQALRVRSELQARGVEVRMDDSFDPGSSVLVNVGRAVGRAVVVALISSDYLDRYFTEMEVSAVLGNPSGKFLPVVAGAVPNPTTDRGRDLWTVIGSRSYYHLEQSEVSYDRLAELVVRKFSQSPHSASPDAPLDTIRNLVVVYDWEDSYRLDRLETQLAARGITSAAFVPAASARAIPADEVPRVAILWTDASQVSPETSQVLLAQVAAGIPALYVVLPDSPLPPPGASTLALEASRPSSSSGSGVFLAYRTRQQMTEDLKAELQAAEAANGGIPFNLLGDKFCASRNVASRIRGAYRTAVSALPPTEPVRLEAVLAHAAACRFRGEWKTARELLTEASYLTVQRSPLTLSLEIDLLSLSFEVGVGSAELQARELLSRSLAAADWPSIISMHRQLGMIYEEQGRYSVARDHLSRAVHYSEDLVDSAPLSDRIPSRNARRALAADCGRELAALEWRAGNPAYALDLLRAAESIVQTMEPSSARRYVERVVQYQRARVEFSITRDYEDAKALLQECYLALQEFDNPIRLATVLESLVRLEMDFLRPSQEQAAALRATLGKVQRVRKLRGHGYMIARAIEALGDLEFTLGDWNEALAKYQEARSLFNRYGKMPEAANTARLLARCHLRLADSDRAVTMFEAALADLEQSDTQNLRSQIRAELALAADGRVALDAVEPGVDMTSVGGEFSVHEWITHNLGRVPREQSPIDLGVGDDAALVSVGDGGQMAVSVDSVPPSIIESGLQSQSPRLASRFAVVSSLADILAMGAEPTGILLNLHVRRATPASWSRDLIRLVAREAGRFGVELIGGDLKERDCEEVTTASVGWVPKGRALTRSGAQVGDYIAITCSSGPETAFDGLGTGWARELAPQLSRAERQLIADIVTESAAYSRMGLPLNVMREVIQRGVANAAIDTSDGLLACARLLGEGSLVGTELFTDELDALIHADVKTLSSALGIPPFLFALNAGHDWEIVLTVPPSRVSQITELATRKPGDPSAFPRIAVIGRVVRREEWSSSHVQLRRSHNVVTRVPFFTDEKFVRIPYQERSRDWLDFAVQVARAVDWS